MRIATYNIQYWTGMDQKWNPERTLAAIQELAADIIALQEVVHPVEGMEDPPPLERAAEMMGGHFVFAPIWDAGTLPHIPGPLGIALISRYPIIAHAIHTLDPLTPVPPRKVLEVRVEPPDAPPLILYTTHLDWRSEDVRATQVRSLLRWTTRDLGRPHLLLGDFNSVHPQDIPTYERLTGEPWKTLVKRIQAEYPQAPLVPKAIPPILKKGYIDAFTLAGEGDPRTYTTAEPVLRLDYCFIDPVLAPAVQRVHRWETELSRIASDHYPLIVDLKSTTTRWEEAKER